MPQNNVVMSFRKRLKKRGYTNISIKKNKGIDTYLVTANEPLAKTEVTCEYSTISMYYSFRF